MSACCHAIYYSIGVYLLSFDMSIVLVLPVDIINYFNTSLLFAYSLPQIHNSVRQIV